MAWITFHSFTKGQFGGGGVTNLPIATLTSADIRLALISSVLAPVAATHDFWNDLSANEVSGTNYTAGGIALASKTFTLVGSSWVFDAENITIAQHASGFSNARYAILRLHNATASQAPLIAYLDMGSNKGNVASSLVIEFSSLGIIRAPA